MENKDAYPLKYAEQVITSKDGSILEAGCGAGRILRHYHDRGFDIVGIDFIRVAVQKLAQIDPTLNVEVGDITQLRFADATFKYLPTFGLYHNLEQGLERAVQEIARVLEIGGMVCGSFRAGNFQTRLTDGLTRLRKFREVRGQKKVFHKMNLTKREFTKLFEKAGFEVEFVAPVKNMPILY